MDIVKKNLISVICGAVALLALLAYFWPLGGYQSDLQMAAEQRVTVYRRAQGLLTKARSAPVVNPDNPAAVSLERFPSPEVIREGARATKEVTAQAQNMLKLAVDLNRRKPLVEGSLPNPSDPAAYRFRDEYRKLMMQASPQDKMGTLARQVLRAGTPPTVDEINAAKTELWNSKYLPNIPLVLGNPDATALAAAQAEYQKELVTFPDELRSRRARECMIYINADALEVSGAIVTGFAAPPPSAIWAAQLSAWVQEDAARAIAAINKSGSSVLDAPVKHLIKIQVQPNFINSGGPNPDPNAPITRNNAISMTGRVSNGLYDVVHYRMIVIVETSKIPAFLTELGRDRFVTPLELEVAAVDSAAASAQGYVYGNQPVAQLALKCETLLLREWTKSLMPPSVLRALGLMPRPA